MKLILRFVALFLLVATPALAQFPQEGPTLNRKVRNLGMGNVGIALQGTADSSPFYNPAGLNDLEKGRFQFFSPTFDMSKDGIRIAQDMKDLTDSLKASNGDAEATSILDQFIKDHVGEYEHLRLTLDVLNYARHNFAAGVLFDERIDFSFRNLAYPNFQVQNLGDVAGYVSGAYDFFEKAIQFGVTLRPTARFAMDEADQEITFADAVDGPNGDPLVISQLEKIKGHRFGLAVDLGLKSNLNFLKDVPGFGYLKPEVGFTWQDMGGVSFGAARGNEQAMGVGMAVHPDIWKIKNSVALDFRDLNQERDFLSKVHFGVESQLPWILALRLGMSQGYFTAGLGLDFWIMTIDAAYYNEEIGVFTREDNNARYAINISFNI